MIPGNFVYHRPSNLDEAVRLFATLGDAARPLAGGHSLIPMMKLRMAVPEHLVDLAGIAALKGIREDAGRILIGATTTQAELIQSDLLAARLPILREAALQIRSKGTLGGNLANGDPGNDMPAVMQCLDATFILTGPKGDRPVPAREFYQAAYVTAAEPGEILTGISIPVPPADHGWAYGKLKRKVGDYATAAPMFQAHTFEDRVLKVDYVKIGAGATVRHGTVPLYGAVVGEHAHVGPHSVIMKQEHLLPYTTYQGVPTRVFGRED